MAHIALVQGPESYSGYNVDVLCTSLGVVNILKEHDSVECIT